MCVRIVLTAGFFMMTARVIAQQAEVDKNIGRVEVHESLDDAMASVANELAVFLKAEPSRAGARVAVGRFIGPQGSSGGARIVQSLKEQLGEKIASDGSAAFSLGGRYEPEKRDEKFAIAVAFELTETSKSRAHPLRTRIVTDPATCLALLGATVNLSQQVGSASASPGGSPVEPVDQAQRADLIVESLVYPEVHTEGSVLFTSADKRYGIELLIKKGPEYESCPLDADALNDGIAKVNVGAKDVFAVRIHNRTQATVGVALAIDGIHVFAFSTNPYWRKLGKVCVEPGAPIIQGWHHRGSISHEFTVTRYGNSAAARFGATEGIGIVTATFFPVFASKDGRLAAGLGKETVKQYGELPAEFGQPLGAVSVRYLRPADAANAGTPQ